MSTLATEVEVTFSPLLHRYTLEEFWELPDPDDRFRYELIGGHLFMVPPPDPPHDDIDARLNKSLVLIFHFKGKVLWFAHNPARSDLDELEIAFGK